MTSHQEGIASCLVVRERTPPRAFVLFRNPLDPQGVGLHCGVAHARTVVTGNGVVAVGSRRSAVADRLLCTPAVVVGVGETQRGDQVCGVREYAPEAEFVSPNRVLVLVRQGQGTV